MSFDSWSELYLHRQRVRQKYPSIWDIPLVKKETDRLFEIVSDDMRVLEVGAGDRRFGRRLQALYQNIEYRSLDIDRATQQDYYRIEDIDCSFDCIYAFELIEHLTPAEGLNLLNKLHGLLRPHGRLLIGTPNLYHPHRYWGDITHKTPYKYEELGGLMMMAGFALPSIFRIYNDALLRRWFRLHIGILLHRYLDIDFAGTVLLEATPAK
ncbi:methyltransferase domain-containing protein [Sulfuricystis multivorans]|uniref:methyltransferase domain-containing protein n=1 Tax=Sulfuricystis multivorans TaxID=2211108 RepID=UPI000F81D7A4|nr:class I SAM-dependent methyltransferase [Sulfuricystis multivorans]